MTIPTTTTNNGQIKLKTAEELLLEHRQAQGFDLSPTSPAPSGGSSQPPGGMVQTPPPSGGIQIPDEPSGGDLISEDTSPADARQIVQDEPAYVREQRRRSGYGVQIA
jgi:hypothetical protein